MAQAARLSLRMQKELKILLSDPPPGASFPSLSDDSTSLTAIDSQIEGPKGTVYENGYFHIKIQIPERYPFQPPVVTFATPIYHPNIDTGGRICLDILNLPPKGAWQPSLNISTVITSIGLLLSEPNPDDGLMCEASKEYKYNRQAFDKKARTMTEKYAKALSSSSNEGLHISSKSCHGDEKGFKNEVIPEVTKFKLHSLSKKLSLQSSGSIENSNDKRLADQPNIELPNSQIEVENRLGSKYNPCHGNGNDDRLSEKRKKLSLEGLCQSQKMSSDKTGSTSHTVEDGGSSHWDGDFSIGAEAQVCQKFPADCSSKMLYDRYNTQQVTQLASTSSCHSLPKTSSLKTIEVQCVELKPSVDDKHNKNPRSNKKLNLGYQVLEKNTNDDNKENTPHVELHQTTRKPTNQSNELQLASTSITGKNAIKQTLSSKLNSSSKHQEEVHSRRSSLCPLQNLQANQKSSSEANAQDKSTSQQMTRKSEASMSNETIVMDSEDEEEKNEPVSSKVIVSRRRLCLAGKRKAK